MEMTSGPKTLESNNLVNGWDYFEKKKNYLRKLLCKGKNTYPIQQVVTARNSKEKSTYSYILNSSHPTAEHVPSCPEIAAASAAAAGPAAGLLQAQ